MSQKITFEKVVGAATQTVTLTLKNSKYLLLESDWELAENVLQDVFSGDESQNARGWYLTVSISYSTIKNPDLFAMQDIFMVGTKNILFYPDSNSIERYEMKIPKTIHVEDFLETYQRNFDIVLRSKKRYLNPLPHDISYIGTRKIDISDRHIQINGTIV